MKIYGNHIGIEVILKTNNLNIIIIIIKLK